MRRGDVGTSWTRSGIEEIGDADVATGLPAVSVAVRRQVEEVIGRTARRHNLVDQELKCLVSGYHGRALGAVVVLDILQRQDGRSAEIGNDLLCDRHELASPTSSSTSVSPCTNARSSITGSRFSTL